MNYYSCLMIENFFLNIDGRIDDGGKVWDYVVSPNMTNPLLRFPAI